MKRIGGSLLAAVVAGLVLDASAIPAQAPDGLPPVPNVAAQQPAPGTDLPTPTTDQWLPKTNEPYQNLALVSSKDELVMLDSLKGRTLLVEFAAAPSEVSQSLAGAAKAGSLGGPKPDPDVLALGDMVRYFAKGATPGTGFAHVVVLVAGASGGAALPPDAAAWASHFGFKEENGEYVYVAAPATQELGVMNFAPGFHLVDKEFILRRSATSGEVAERLRLELLPELARLASPVDESKKDGSGTLKLTLDDLNSVAGNATTEESPADGSASGDVDPGRFIRPVTVNDMQAIIDHEKKLVVVYVFSSDSLASREIWPIAGQLAVKNLDKATMLRLDVRGDQPAVQALQLQYLPTFILFKGGKEVGRVGGQFHAEDVQSAIDQNSN